MFISRMIDTDVYKPITARDEYNFEYANYEACGKSPVYLTNQSVEEYAANDLELTETNYVGYTTDRNISKGWLVGNAKVNYVMPGRNYNTLYLTKVDDK
jgi:hypothetical protein